MTSGIRLTEKEFKTKTQKEQNKILNSRKKVETEKQIRQYYETTNEELVTETILELNRIEHGYTQPLLEILRQRSVTQTDNKIE